MVSILSTVYSSKFLSLPKSIYSSSTLYLFRIYCISAGVICLLLMLVNMFHRRLSVSMIRFPVTSNSLVGSGSSCVIQFCYGGLECSATFVLNLNFVKLRQGIKLDCWAGNQTRLLECKGCLLCCGMVKECRVD